VKQSFFLLLLLGGVAEAQVSDVEVPTIVIDTSDAATSSADDEAIDLANIVQSAAKGVTTVQEAPAIVTVVTQDEIRERQFQTLQEIVDTVPGWMQSPIANGMLETPLVRGQVQAVQFLHDGLSQFDTMVNLPTINRVYPMETVKRVELITGPGGVLWGSNSLLGILNVITKDAEDVEGIETGGAIGDGDGDRKVARAYVMAGDSEMLDGKAKGFVHGSFETFQGPRAEAPLMLFHNPLPQPNSANTYGPLASGMQKQSYAVNVDGKLTYGKFQLRGLFQTGHFYKPLAFAGTPVRYGDEDPRWKDVKFEDIFDEQGTSHKNSWETFDRYVIGEYRDRFAKDKAGISLRGYFQQFIRGFNDLQVLAPSSLIVGGVAFHTNLTNYRVGGAFDGDVEVSKKLRVLYGAETFHEWKPVDTTTARGGTGNQADFIAPVDLTRLPIACPRIYDQEKKTIVPVPGCPMTFAYEADRTVMGAYLNPQLRPNKKLILDAGGRVMVAPEQLGSVAYPVNFTVGGTIVYGFIPNWHLKLNYTQGFRPPVFNNTSPNGEGIVIGGDPGLQVETSDAMQAEINARIFKGDRRIRELSFRADASYTRLNGLIQVQAGQYNNAADRGLASGEFLGKLYIQGGHRFELGYTYLRAATGDRGLLKTLPEHWFNLASIFSLVPNKLTAMTNLKIVGAMEDPNRLVEYRDASFDMMGEPVNVVNVLPTDLVMDRLPPQADLQLGMTYTPTEKLMIRATVYNALVQHRYHVDAFMDYEPHLEYQANPAPRLRAYLSAMYSY
jgi:outer membrane receptor protein involved in Fe transport